MDTTPYWFNTALPAFPSIEADHDVDVVIAGGGLTGITTAYLLKQSGARIALLERQRCAAADTGHTTAHLTFVTDIRLHELVKNFGRDGAKAFWDAGAAAIDQIFDIVRREQISCEFAWVPGFLHGKLSDSDEKDRASLQEDAALAQELGFRAAFVDQVPYANKPGVRFDNQAKFHARKYLAHLVSTLPGNGSFVFENTELSEVTDEPLTVHAGGRRIRCRYIVIATHSPIMGKSGILSATLFQTKLALYTSYVVGARVTSGTVPEALFWDTSEPYYYLRVDRRPDHDYLIFGGEDCKTGQEQDARAVFSQLEGRLKSVLPSAQVEDHWLGQVVETNDGLPFIGEMSSQQFVATGFSGNGFTLGTLSAVMARDRFLGQANPWFDLFDVGRRKLKGGTWKYITENVDYPYHLLRDRMARADVPSTDSIPLGQGAIAKVNGKKAAAYRSETGKLTVLSPVCTHLGCIVRWNDADRTWDCPCHGSRFKSTGEVFSGPAEDPLPPLE